MTTFTRQLAIILSLAPSIYVGAQAEVWKWVDADGETHYVDSNRPIYTWLDENGRVYYSDKADHPTAVNVVLDWYSDEELGDVLAANEDADGGQEEAMSEAEYCSNAREIYASYLKAPLLYKTGENGERAFLSNDEAAATLLATKAKVDELCE